MYFKLVHSETLNVSDTTLFSESLLLSQSDISLDSYDWFIFNQCSTFVFMDVWVLGINRHQKHSSLYLILVYFLLFLSPFYSQQCTKYNNIGTSRNFVLMTLELRGLRIKVVADDMKLSKRIFNILLLRRSFFLFLTNINDKYK